MPKVHTHVARKDYPSHGIKKGDTYYRWKLRMGRGGVEYKSKSYPRRSQLTNSEFLGQAYDLDDEVSDAETPEDLREIAGRVRELGEEQDEKFNNMSDALQGGDTGQLLEERSQQCGEWADAIEAAADQWETEIDNAPEGEDVDAEEFKGDASCPF